MAGLKQGNVAPVLEFVPRRQRAERAKTTRDEVARLVGLGSGRRYEKLKAKLEEIEAWAPDFLPRLEAGDLDLNDKAIRDAIAGSPGHHNPATALVGRRGAAA